MELSKHNRNQNSQKFVIKARPSLAHLRSQNSDPELPTCLDQQVQLFLQHMISKSKRFRDLLAQKNVQNLDEFCEKQLLKSVCLKTILKTVLDKMIHERRLGKNLKGLNKGNLMEIQNCIWSCMLREIQLYKNGQEYTRGKQELQNILAQRKNEIIEELSKISAKISSTKE